MSADKKLARKYAQACLQVWGSTVDELAYKEFIELADVLRAHKPAFFFLKLSYMSVQDKQRALLVVTHKKSIAPLVDQLIELLARHQRTNILDLVVRAVCSLYKRINKIMHFDIKSSHTLTEKQIHALHNFIMHKTGHTITYDVTLDKSLIAGIRLQSNSLLWEYSIRKQLASVANCVAR